MCVCVCCFVDGMRSLAVQDGHAPVKQDIVLSGMQCTGIPTLGNYIGATRQWVRLQDNPTAKIFYTAVGSYAISFFRGWEGKRDKNGLREEVRGKREERQVSGLNSC